MNENKKKRGRYQEKRALGLVPFIYNKDSRSFLTGAWKFWPAGTPSECRQVNADANFLANRRTNYHRFV